MQEDRKGKLKAQLEDEKNYQDFEFAKLRKQLDEQKTLIGNQRKLLNQLQCLNQVTQAGITQSSQELASRVREKQNLSMQINDKVREQEKISKRHNYLQNEIKNCIPTKVGPDGQLIQKYQPEDITILPDQHKVYHEATGTYANINEHKVRSWNAMFSKKKNPIEYDQIKEDKE